MKYTETVDWDNAPEDAGYYFLPYFYKIEDETAYFWDEDYADWRESGYPAETVRLFTPLPVSSEQPVSAEVETNISIETVVGLTPKNIWEEQMQRHRRQDIHAAMQRYIVAGKEIPNEWLYELIELNNILAEIETDFTESVESSPVAEDGKWIEWGKEASPDIPDDTLVVKVYSDGDVKTGKSGDTRWFGLNGLDDKPYVVTRYRIIGE